MSRKRVLVSWGAFFFKFVRINKNKPSSWRKEEKGKIYTTSSVPWVHGARKHITTKRFNTDMLLCFWAKRTAQFGRLALFMVAAIQALPAEACIERFFSHGKLVLDATRMRLQDRPTEAQMFVKVNDAMRRRPHPKPAAEDVGMLELMTHTPPTWTTLINLAVIFAEAVHAGEHEALGAKLEWRELDAPASDSDASEASDDAQGDDAGDDESD